MTSSSPPPAISKLVDHKLELSDLMGALLKDSLNSDITFNVQGEDFRAHRAILSIHSPVLRKLLEQTALEQPINLPDKRAASFSIFLRYLYTGLFDVSNVACVDISIAAEVLAIAHQYQVENLESSLGETLKAFVNLDTVFILFQVAFDVELEGLLNFCRDFMCENAKAVVRSPLFNTLSEKAVMDILSNDYFAAPEMEILKAITIWHENNKDVDLSGIFSQVRFHLACLDGWSLVEVCKICKLLNSYNLNLEQLVSPMTDDGKPKQPRYSLATANLASVHLGATVLREGRVRHGNYMVDGSYSRREVGDATILGYETKIKGKVGYAVVKLPKLVYVNSLSIVAANRCNDPHAVNRPDGYNIFSSVDNSHWDLIADCKNRDCSGCKAVLFFPTRPLQYIRIVGDARNDGDCLFVMKLSCPAECTEDDIARYKSICQECPVTLLYIPSQDREITMM